MRTLSSSRGGSRLGIVLGVSVFFVCGLGIAQSPEGYFWPLSQARALTSSFGEYRADRFHMGIDLRTGPVGKEVFAAGSGFVARVRCSPYGYGKAVYLQLDDGHMAVYAHLSDFMPELREHVRSEQHRQKSYTVDLYPEKNKFRVERGQWIAKSGQTGIGVPHLHWEMRDHAGTPVNPTLLGLEWPDNTRPRFRSLLVIPTTPETRINGDYVPVVIPIRRLGDGRYTAGSITVAGSVAFGVDLYDPANGGASKLGVHRIETRVDDESIFEMLHDRIGYVHARDGAVAYHPYYIDKGKFLMQWPWPGIKTELYGGRKSGGEISVQESPRNVEILANDFFGNSGSVEINLRPSGVETVADFRGVESASGQVFYDVVGNWLVVTVEFDSAEGTAPVLLGAGGRPVDAAFSRVSDRKFRARYRGESSRSIVRLSVQHPRAGQDAELGLPLEHSFLVAREDAKSVHSTLGDIELNIDSEDVYGTLFVTTGIEESESAGTLEPKGPGYRIWPERAPLRSAIDVRVPLPDGDGLNRSRLGVYRKGIRSWQRIPATINATSISFETRKLGLFQLMEDGTRPEVSFRKERWQRSTGSRTPEIRVVVRDAGSGIASWRCRYEGKWLLMAYDPEQDLLIWERDVPLPIGEGTLTISVTDEAGNEAVQEILLTVSGS